MKMLANCGGIRFGFDAPSVGYDRHTEWMFSFSPLPPPSGYPSFALRFFFRLVLHGIGMNVNVDTTDERRDAGRR